VYTIFSIISCKHLKKVINKTIKQNKISKIWFTSKSSTDMIKLYKIVCQAIIFWVRNNLISIKTCLPYILLYFPCFFPKLIFLTIKKILDFLYLYQWLPTFSILCPYVDFQKTRAPHKFKKKKLPFFIYRTNKLYNIRNGYFFIDDINYKIWIIVNNKMD